MTALQFTEDLAVFAALQLLLLAISVPHILLFKSDHRASLGWLGLVFLLPIAGPLCYWLFGINRVRRKAQHPDVLRWTDQGSVPRVLPALLEGADTLEQVGLRVSGQPLVADNRVKPLFNGEAAFPAMLEAIEGAQQEVLLSTFIFDDDELGRQFVAALAAAMARGVVVAVLIDDLGRRFRFPTILPPLRRAGIPVRRFMPLKLLPPSVSLNLRNHRKLLIVDRRCGFTGGMNISARHLLDHAPANAAADVHFQFEGHVVAGLVATFIEDWTAAGSAVAAPALAPAESVGSGAVEADRGSYQASRASSEASCVSSEASRVSSEASRGANDGLPERCTCRLIADGPGAELDRLPLLLSGIVSAAQSRVWIMTPYFLPEARLVGALQSAALRGVDVRVVVPERSNWPPVDWAMGHGLWRLVNVGVRIVEQPLPFCHAKYLLIDDDYALVGSSNLDPRSLRLNFELNVEVFSPALNAELGRHLEAACSAGVTVGQEQIRNRSVFMRLRDAFAALFTPYL